MTAAVARTSSAACRGMNPKTSQFESIRGCSASLYFDDQRVTCINTTTDVLT